MVASASAGVLPYAAPIAAAPYDYNGLYAGVPAINPYAYALNSGNVYPLAEPYIHQEPANIDVQIAAEPYVHEEIPAEPYVDVQVAAEPYIHQEPLPVAPVVAAPAYAAAAPAIAYAGAYAQPAVYAGAYQTAYQTAYATAPYALPAALPAAIKY